MPYTVPSRSDVHINAPLTNISIAYAQDASHFVAARVFPVIPVTKQSDAYFTYNKDDFNRNDMAERAAGTESSGGTYDIGNETYFARVYAYHRDIPDQVRANADAPLDMDREATIFVTQKAMLKRESLWAANYFTAGNPGDTWTFDVDGASTDSGAAFDPTNAANNQRLFWNDAASNPIENIREGKRYVLEATGFVPNTLTVGQAVYDTMCDHPAIVDRIDRGQTTGPAKVGLVTLADLFEVDQVLVMRAIQNTAPKTATATHSFIGGKHALLSYAPPEPGLMTPSAGYTFAWTGLTGAGDEGMRIKRFHIDTLESDRIEISMSFDQKKIAPDLGYFFGNIVQ